MENLKEYALDFADALARQTPITFHNRDMAHASVVVTLAFFHAKKTVLLLSQKLDPAVYSVPWFTETAQEFIDRGGLLHILVEDMEQLDESHPVVELYRANAGNNFQIKAVPSQEVKTYKFNFMVVDDDGFRFEPDRKNPRALVAFNETDPSHQKMIRTLKQFFRRLFENSESI